MTILLHSVGYGLVTGTLLAVCAVGLTLQFGVTNYPNVSYCQYMTLGALTTWELSHHVSMWLAALISILIVGLLSVLVGRHILGAYVRRGGSNLYLVLASFALTFVFSGLMTAWWGTSIFQYPLRVEHPHGVGPFLFTNSELGILALTAFLLTSSHVLLSYTQLGKSMRAMADNKSLAQLCGIPTSRVTDAVWLMSGVLGASGGIALALSVGVFDIQLGLNFL